MRKRGREEREREKTVQPQWTLPQVVMLLLTNMLWYCPINFSNSWNRGNHYGIISCHGEDQ